MEQVAQPRRWMVPNASPRGGEIEIAGWDFGGEGPLILMSHANGLCAAPWTLVARELSPQYRVIAVDSRGHGDSAHLQVPDDYEWIRFAQDLIHVARQMLSEIGADRVHLGLGSSFGGIVTAMAEAAEPGLFARIMMLDPPIHPREELLEELGLDLTPEGGDRRTELVAQTLRRRAVWESREQAYAAWRDKVLFKPWQEQAFELYLTEGMSDRADGSVELKCPPEVEAHIFASTGSVGPIDYAPLVQAPVRLVHARDGFFPLEFFRHIAGMFPHGELTQLAGGHMLPLEVPELVVEHVREWLGATQE